MVIGVLRYLQVGRGLLRGLVRRRGLVLRQTRGLVLCGEIGVLRYLQIGTGLVRGTGLVSSSGLVSGRGLPR